MSLQSAPVSSPLANAHFKHLNRVCREGKHASRLALPGHHLKPHRERTLAVRHPPLPVLEVEPT